MDTTDKTPPPTANLGDLLAQWRRDRGWSLAQAAEALAAAGCERTRGGLHHYERGGGMRRDVADAIVVAFDLNANDARRLYEAAGYVVHLSAGGAT